MDRTIKILNEDDGIIVCVKPAGFLSEGDGPDSLITILSDGRDEIYPVHRLDRETGGVMVYAKTPAAAADLSEQVRSREMQKRYYAVLKGSPAEKGGELNDLLFRDRQKGKTFVVKRERKGVRDARLEYTVKGEKENLALADILLHTGRTHQIRAQFSSRKLPLYGDGRYGGGSGQLALFAYSLSFTNPSSKEKLTFTVKPDTDVYPWSLFEEIL